MSQATEVPFATRVVDFSPGPGAGFGQEQMPSVVLGPPVGGGEGGGSLDVVSLGAGGQITLALGVDVVDGPGPDLIVFENPFHVNGNKNIIWRELGEVSVSLDGVSWSVFPCVPASYQESQCAGWRPVFSTPTNGIEPTDPAVAGGDPFDLAALGVERARFVKIRDLSSAGASPSAGFDLDAVAVIHAAR